MYILQVEQDATVCFSGILWRKLYKTFFTWIKDNTIETNRLNKYTKKCRNLKVPFAIWSWTQFVAKQFRNRYVVVEFYLFICKLVPRYLTILISSDGKWGCILGCNRLKDYIIHSIELFENWFGLTPVRRII